MIPFDEFGWPADNDLLPVVPHGGLPTDTAVVPDTDWEIPVYRPVSDAALGIDPNKSVAQQEKEWEDKWAEHYKYELDESSDTLDRDVALAESEGMVQVGGPPVRIPGIDVPKHECDRSEMRRFTPRMYCMINGLYGATDRDIDEISQRWDTDGEDYMREIAFYPPHVRAFYDDLPYLHDARVELVARSGDDITDSTVFRFTPATNDGPVEVEIHSVWMDTKVVLPESLRTKGTDNLYLFEEFQVSEEPPGINLYFYTSDGTQYGFECVTDIRIRKLSVDVPLARTRSRKKPTRLFTVFLHLEDTLAVLQVKSHDWSTVWGDVQESVKNRLHRDTDDEETVLVWSPVLEPYKNNRNVYSGHVSVDGKQLEVVIVNTKRGKPPGVDDCD